MASKIKMQSIYRLILCGVGILLLSLGGGIYVSFRPTSLNLFKWFDKIQATPLITQIRLFCKDLPLPDFVVFALPDGLWIASYLLFIVAIWRSFCRWEFTFASFMPIIGIISELGQFVNLVPGTFDWMDLVCYATPFIVYIFLRSFMTCRTQNKSIYFAS